LRSSSGSIQTDVPTIASGYVVTNSQEENGMTITTQTATKRASMDTPRKTAFVAGALYLVTFATSIPAVDGSTPDPDLITTSA
jgi:hypothetical protein